MPRVSKGITVQEQINLLVQRIVKKFRPEQIILFGSHARGDARADSDIDLLIVMPFEGSKLEMGLVIRRAVGDWPIPFDLILSTPEEFAWRKDVVGTIEWPATREGKVLYADPEGPRRSDTGVAGQGRQ